MQHVYGGCGRQQTDSARKQSQQQQLTSRNLQSSRSPLTSSTTSRIGGKAIMQASSQAAALQNLQSQQSEWFAHLQQRPSSPSTLTKLSQHHLKDMLSHSRLKKSQSGLLSVEQVAEYERDHRGGGASSTSAMKAAPPTTAGAATSRSQQLTSREKLIVDRLFYDKSAEVAKQEAIKQREEHILNECTFSPQPGLRSMNMSSHETHNNSSHLKRNRDFYDKQLRVQASSDASKEAVRIMKQAADDKEIKEKPKLCKRTVSINEELARRGRIKSNDVFERLLADKTPPPRQEEPSHIPTISQLASTKKRPMRIDIFLYEDAKKKHEELSLEEKHKNEEASSSTQAAASAGSRGWSRSTLKPVIGKLDKDFQEAVADMAFTVDPRRTTLPETLNYLEVSEVLQRLAYLKPERSGTYTARRGDDTATIAAVTHNSQVMQRIWQQIKSPVEKYNKDTVIARNLEVFLFAVNNIKVDNSVIPFVSEEQLYYEATQQQHLQQLTPDREAPRQQQRRGDEKNPMSIEEKLLLLKSKQQLPIIGQFDRNGNLIYQTDEQVLTTSRLFRDIFDTRMAATARNKSPISTASAIRDTSPIDEYTFIPKISKHTRKLAIDKRNQVVEEIKNNEGFDGGEVDINEVLVYQQQLGRYRAQQKAEEQKADELRECTFHPQTNDYKLVEKYFSRDHGGAQSSGAITAIPSSSSHDASSQKRSPERRHTPLGIHRTIELHSLGKPRNFRRDRDKLEIEYERECDECTFSPDINHMSNILYSSIGSSSQNPFSSLTSSIQRNPIGTGSPANMKAMQKAVDRLTRGRIDSQIKHSLEENGMTVSKTKRQKISQEVISAKDKHRCHERTGKPCIQSHRTNMRIINSSPRPGGSHATDNIIDYQGLCTTTTIKLFLLRQPPPQPASNSHPSTNRSQQIQGEYFLRQPDEVVQSERSAKTVDEERVPLLFVDVNIEDGKTARIIVYEGEKSEDLALKFAQEHNLDAVMTGRLKDLLDQQINSLLTKIDEEIGSDHDEEDEDGEMSLTSRQRKRAKGKAAAAAADMTAVAADNSHLSSERPSEKKAPVDRNSEGRSHSSSVKNSSNLLARSPSHEDTANLHMLALATTFNNYVSSPMRQKELPEYSPNTGMSRQDVENMHMKALAQTFTNYSTNILKLSTLPLANDAAVGGASSRASDHLSQADTRTYKDTQYISQQQQPLSTPISNRHGVSSHLTNTQYQLMDNSNSNVSVSYYNHQGVQPQPSVRASSTTIVPPYTPSSSSLLRSSSSHNKHHVGGAAQNDFVQQYTPLTVSSSTKQFNINPQTPMTPLPLTTSTASHFGGYQTNSNALIEGILSSSSYLGKSSKGTAAATGYSTILDYTNTAQLRGAQAQYKAYPYSGMYSASTTATSSNNLLNSSSNSSSNGLLKNHLSGISHFIPAVTSSLNAGAAGTAAVVVANNEQYTNSSGTNNNKISQVGTNLIDLTSVMNNHSVDILHSNYQHNPETTASQWNSVKRQY